MGGRKYLDRAESQNALEKAYLTPPDFHEDHISG
jgi:hypothetical protein